MNIKFYGVIDIEWFGQNAALDSQLTSSHMECS